MAAGMQPSQVLIRQCHRVSVSLYPTQRTEISSPKGDTKRCSLRVAQASKLSHHEHHWDQVDGIELIQLRLHASTVVSHHRGCHRGGLHKLLTCDMWATMSLQVSLAVVHPAPNRNNVGSYKQPSSDRNNSPAVR